MEVPAGTLPPAVAAASRSSSHPNPRTVVRIFTSQRSPSLKPSEISRAPGARGGQRQTREISCGRRVQDLPQFPLAYWIFTAKMTTVDCPGVRVPTVALMVPAVPFAGALIVPTVVLAGGMLLYTVNDGVASLTTTLVTLEVPALVAVIR